MKRQVPSDSIEWTQMDHQVQVVTGKSSVKVISVYRFEDDSKDTVIMRNGKEKSWIDATVNVTDFSKQYYKQVIDKSVALEDLIVYAGHVNIHRYSSQPYKIFTFLFCKVCLGTAGTPQTPMSGECDSIIIPPENQQAFQYNFFVKHSNQYRVKYEVSFTVSDDKQFKLSELSCCNCQNRSPALHCLTEKLNFCEDCCNDHHKTKLMHSHHLQNIDRINTLQNCKTHNQKFQLYCLKCQKYLCSQCTQKGVHAQGNDHLIKPIRYLYEQLNENIQNLPKKALEKIEVLLYNLKVKRNEVQQNEREVRQQIQNEFRKSLRILDEEAAAKYQILDSSELQLTMLKDKISWNQSFCVFQSNTLKPIHFFRSQNIFETQMKSLKVSDFDSILNCKPDLVYYGTNQVGSKDFIERSKKPSNSVPFEPPNNITSNDPSRVKTERIQASLKPSIFSFDPNSLPPLKDELVLDLESCGLKFFMFKRK